MLPWHSYRAMTLPRRKSAKLMPSGVIMFLASWLWLNEFRYPQHMRKVQAIAYGLVLALIPLKSMALFGDEVTGWLSAHNQPEIWIGPWMGEALVSAESEPARGHKR